MKRQSLEDLERIFNSNWNSRFEEAINCVLKPLRNRDISFDHKLVEKYRKYCNKIIQIVGYLLPMDFFKNDEDAILSRHHNLLNIFNRNPSENGDLSTSARHRRCPLWIVFILLNMVYAIYLGVWTGIMHWKFQSQMKFWDPQVVAGANRTQNCAHPKDIIYYRDKRGYEGLMKQRQLLLEFGIPATPANIMLPACTVTGALVIILTLSGYLLSVIKGLVFSYSVQVFCSYPELTRRRIRESGVLLLDSILAMQNTSIHDSPIIKNINRISNAEDDRNKNYMFYQNPVQRSHRPDKNTPTIEGHISTERKLSAELRIFHSLMEPHCYSVWAWHLYINVRKYSGFLVFLAWMMTLILGIGVFLGKELSIRFDMRLKYLDCELWDRDAVFIRDYSMSIDIFEPSYKHRLKLWDYKNGITTNWLVCYLHEFVLMCNPRFVFVWAELIIGCSLAGFWLSHDYIIYIDGFLFKFIWSQQIIRELRACSRALVILGHGRWPIYEHPAIKSSRYKQMEAALLIAYCNFELYRKNQHYYRTFYEYYCFKNCLVTVGFVVLIYTTYSKLASEGMAFIVFLIFLSVCLTNVTNLICLLIMIKFQRIYCLLNDIVGKMSHVMSSKFYLIAVYQRRLLHDDDVQLLYSTKVIGIQLTRTMVISLNSYIIAALVFLFVYNR